MIYKFTYYYNNKLINETYYNELSAVYRFSFLCDRRIAFKVISITKRRNKFYD